MTRPGHRCWPIVALSALLVLSLGAPAIHAAHPEGGSATVRANAPCVETIDLATSISPVAGGTRTVDFSFLAFDANGANDLVDVDVNVHRPDGTVLHARIADLIAEPQSDTRLVRYAGTFPMRFHDAPTDAGTAYTLRIDLTDASGTTGTTATRPFDYEALAAIHQSTTQITFGAIEPGEDSATSTLTITNQGNLPVDLTLQGTDLAHGDLDANISVDRIHVSPRDSGFESDLTLSSTPRTISDFDLLPGPDAHADVHWYLDTPDAGSQYMPAGSYSGVITIGTMPDPDLAPTAGGGPTEESGLCADAPALLDCDAAAPTTEHQGLAEDPGFAYEDLDDDGRYDVGVDQAITSAELADGVHVVAETRPFAGLVIPASVGTIETDGAVWFASGTDAALRIQADIRAKDDVRLDAGRLLDTRTATIASSDKGILVTSDGDWWFDDGDVTATRTIDGRSVIGAVTADDAFVESRDADVRIAASAWTGRHAEFVAKTALALTLGPGDDDLAYATLESHDGDVQLRGFDGTLRLDCARMTAGQALTLEAAGALRFTQGDLATTDGDVTVAAPDIDAPHAHIGAGGAIRIESTQGGLAAPHLSARSGNDGDGLFVTAQAALVLDDAVLDGAGRLHVASASGPVDARRSTLVLRHAAPLGLHIEATDGALGLQEADVVSDSTATITSGHDLHLHALKVTAKQDIDVLVGGDVHGHDLRVTSADRSIEIHVDGRWAEGAALVHLDAKHEVSVGLGTTTAHDLSGLSARSKDRSVSITAAAPLQLSAADLSAKRALHVGSHGDLDLSQATLRSIQGDATADLGTTSATIDVDGLRVRDRDDRLEVGPGGATMQGAPSEGTASLA